MRFILLGWTIAKRDLPRTALAVVSIAFATVVFVGASFLGQGVPGGASKVRRQFIGGDILIFPESLGIKGVAVYQNPQYSLDFRSLDERGLLGSLLPDIVDRGVMVDKRHSIEDLTSSGKKIESLENVKKVYPIYQLPVVAETEDPPRKVHTTVRARFPSLDSYLGFDDLITQGTYFNDDAERIQVLIENWTPSVTDEAQRQYGYDRFNGVRLFYSLNEPVLTREYRPEYGESIKLYVPKVRSTQEGPVYDYTDLHEIQTEVVGTFELPTETVNWAQTKVTPSGLQRGRKSSGPGSPAQAYPGIFSPETRHWTTSQLQIPWNDFQKIAKRVGMKNSAPTALAVIVRNPSAMDSTVEQIRRRLQAGTVISVPRWFDSQDAPSEPLIKIPPLDFPLHERGQQASSSEMPSFALPQSVTTLLIILAYVMAGTLYAGNIYIALSQRRKELAVMKALGASTGQVLTTILTELLLLAVGGSLVGLLVISPPVIWQLGTARLSAQLLLKTLGQLGAKIFGAALIVSFLFGAVPGFLMAVSRTPGEVLQSGQ